MPQHLLLIEPDEEARQLLAAALMPHGFDVLCPVDSYAALEFATQQAFDALVLNDRMPVIDGPGFLHILQQQSHRIPAIILCDEPAKERASTYPDYPCVDWISKPLRIQDLVSRIHALTQTA